MAATAVAYGTLNMQTEKIWATTTDVFSAPENNVQTDNLAQSDGAIFVRSSVRAKSFSVAGIIRGDSIADTDSLIDQFKMGLRLAQQNFDIAYAGSVRRYVASPQNIMITRERGQATAGWSVQFICASPVGMDTNSSTLLAATPVTTSTASIPIAVGGTYQAEPYIKVTLTAVTGGTSKTITITNTTTLRGIRIIRTWSPGDVLEIDSFNKTVYVNSQVVIFDGQFPKWDVGSQNIGYLDDFTTRTASITAEYTRRWL
jgi:hypothetical protein